MTTRKPWNCLQLQLLEVGSGAYQYLQHSDPPIHPCLLILKTANMELTTTPETHAHTATLHISPFPLLPILSAIHSPHDAPLSCWRLHPRSTLEQPPTDALTPYPLASSNLQYCWP